MRRIAIINQKGGVGKTTTTANLGAALAEQGRRVVLVDMDAQANLSLSLGIETESGSPTSYSVLVGESSFAQALRATTMERVSLVASHIDLSGAELELAGQIGREFLLRDALKTWEDEERAKTGRAPADYVLFDCPPSLGLLSINALATAGEVLITLQTEFLALQGMSKLVEVVQLLRKRLNPELTITGILPCLYESRLKLAREVLGEIRRYFPGQVFPIPIRANVKLAEAPSYGQTIFQYAPDSIGAMDYRCAAREVLRAEARDRDTAALPPFREEVLKGTSYQELVAKALEPLPAPKAAPIAKSPAPLAATTIDTTTTVVRETPSKPAPAGKALAVASAPVRDAAAAPPRSSAKHAAARASEVAAPTVVTPQLAPAPMARSSRKHVDAPAPLAKPSTPPKSASAISTPDRVVKSGASPEAPSTRASKVLRDTNPAPPRTPSGAKLTPTLAPAPSEAAQPAPARTKTSKRANVAAPAVVTPPAEKVPAPAISKSTPPKPPPKAPAPKGETREVVQPAPRTEPTPPSTEAPRKPEPAPAARPATSIPPTNARVPEPKPSPRKTPAAPRATDKELTPHRARSLPRVAARESTPPAKSPAPKPAAAKPRGAETQPIVRADDLPPLPPDAFEILSGSGMDP